MNINFDIISVLIFLPLISAIIILPLKVKNNLFYYSYGCFFSIINFILSIVAMTSYDWRKGGFQFQSFFKFFAETTNSAFSYRCGDSARLVSASRLTLIKAYQSTLMP